MSKRKQWPKAWKWVSVADNGHRWSYVVYIPVRMRGAIIEPDCQRCAVRYIPGKWARPKGEWQPDAGDELSVFRTRATAKAFAGAGLGRGDELWYCEYKPSSRVSRYDPKGTIRVKAVKLLERVEPKG